MAKKQLSIRISEEGYRQLEKIIEIEKKKVAPQIEYVINQSSMIDSAISIFFETLYDRGELTTDEYIKGISTEE